MPTTSNPVLTANTLQTMSLSGSSAGTVVDEIWLVPYANAATFEASYPIGVAHGTITTANLAKIDRRPIDGDGGSTVIYRYSLNFAPKTFRRTGDTGAVGDETRSTDSNVVDISIDKHPNYTPAWATSKPNIDTYSSPQPTFEHEETFEKASFVLSEDVIKDNVGKRSAPPLDDTPSAGKWLMTGKRIRQNGNVIVVTRTWQYAENGWDADIYEEA